MYWFNFSTTWNKSWAFHKCGRASHTCQRWCICCLFYALFEIKRITSIHIKCNSGVFGMKWKHVSKNYNCFWNYSWFICKLMSISFFSFSISTLWKISYTNSLPCYIYKAVKPTCILSQEIIIKKTKPNLSGTKIGIRVAITSNW